MAAVTRNVHLAEQVIFLDGLTGTGKTMMGPIRSYQRVTAPNTTTNMSAPCTFWNAWSPMRRKCL